MTKRPTSRKRFSSGGANLRPIRLVLEPLEARRLLAGMDLSGAHCAATFLTLDYSAGSSTVEQAPPSSSLTTQFHELQAEGEAVDNFYELSENAPPGTLLGPVVFDAPLSGQEYILHSGDARFSIEGKQLYFAGGELDFQAEPLISFTITAVSDASEAFARIDVVIAVTNAAQQPLTIELSGGQVYEHQAGAMIGDLRVAGTNADAQSAYAFYLFDSRFTLSGSQLRLADGVELDFATEPEVLLAVAATDGNHEIFDTVRIEVLQDPAAPVVASSIALDPRQLVELTAGAVVGNATVVDPKDGSYEFSVSDERFEFVGNQLKLRDNHQVDSKLEPLLTLTLTAVGDQEDEATGTFSVTVISVRSPYHNYNLNEDVNGDGFVSPIDALLVINELNARGSGPITTAGGSGWPPMLDVNGDGLLTPIDVLLIINHLNRTRSTEYGPVQRDGLDHFVIPEPEAPHGTEPPIEELAVSNPPAIVELPTGLPEDSDAPPAIVELPTSLPDDSAESELENSVDEHSLVTDLSASRLQDNIVDATSRADEANFFGQFSERSDDRRQRENASIDAELEILLDQLSHSRQAVL